MGEAKSIALRPITRREADAAVKRWHYSGKVVNNSQLHIGVFYEGRLEGAMQFGPSLDKRKIQGLVTGTGWNEFIELNRMAFSDRLPRNSESRALAVAMRLIKQHAPHIKWVVTFADATQCGDGTIYRAAGFVLTGIKRNTQIWEFPNGEINTRMVATDTRRPQRQRLLDAASAEASARESRTSLTDGRSKREQAKARAFSRGDATKGEHIKETGGASMRPFIEAGARPVPGFQLRYIYFIDKAARAALTVPELPYSAIAAAGAGMYKGEKLHHATEETSVSTRSNGEEGGAIPTRSLPISDGLTL